MSIKSRIIIALVLLPLASLLVVGAIALLQNQNSLARQEERGLGRIMLEKTIGYDHIFQRIQQEVEAAASFAGAVFAQPVPTADLGRRLLLPWTGEGYGDERLRGELREDILRLQRIGQMLQALVSSNPYLTLGYFATETAVTVFDNEAVVEVIEAIEAFEPRNRPWYVAARQARGSIWTPLYVDANTKELTVTAATPVFDAAGRLIGVAGLDVLLKTLQADILTLDIGYANEPFMINSEGRVIVRRSMEEKNTPWDRAYHTDNLLETPNEGFRAIVSAMRTGAAGIGQFVGDDARRNYLAYAPIPTVGASLGIIVPRSEIVHPVQDSGRLILLALGVFIIAAIGIGLWLGNQVTRPIEELTVLVDKASKGLLEVDEIPIRRMDEVGVLATAFNRMLTNLATVLRQLESREKRAP
jgi:two-component system sensor histidine kinase/response regulator